MERLAARIIWCEKWRKLDNSHLKSYKLKMPKHLNVRTVIKGIKTHKFKSLPGARAIDADAYDPRSKEDMTFDNGAADFPNKTVRKGMSNGSVSSEVNDCNIDNRVTDRLRATSQRTNETKYDTTISKSPEMDESTANTIKTPSAFYKPTNVSTNNRIVPAMANNFRPYVPFVSASEHSD